MCPPLPFDIFSSLGDGGSVITTSNSFIPLFIKSHLWILLINKEMITMGSACLLICPHPFPPLCIVVVGLSALICQTALFMCWEQSNFTEVICFIFLAYTKACLKVLEACFEQNFVQGTRKMNSECSWHSLSLFCPWYSGLRGGWFFGWKIRI